MPRRGSLVPMKLAVSALGYSLTDMLSGSSQVSATHSKMAGGNDTIHSCPHGHNLTESQGDQAMTQRSRYHCYHISQPFYMCLIPCCVAKSDFFGSVALRPRHSPYPLLPVEQALQIVLQHTSVLPAVDITNTIGRTYIPDT